MQITLGKNKILAVVLAIAVLLNATLYVSLSSTPMPLPSRADSLYGFLDNLPRVFTSNWTANHSGIRSSGIAAVSGDVSVKTPSSENSVPLTADYVPVQGDMIISSSDGAAVLTLDSDKEIFIDANTILELADVKIDSSTNGYVTRLMLHEGNVLSSVHRPLGEHDIYEVRTPMLDMAIRGTTVHVGYDKPDQSSTVAFLTGRGLIRSNDTGEIVDLFAGEQIVQNTDGYVIGDVDRNLLPAYISKSLSNFDEIMHNIDTIDYRAAYLDDGFNAENYTFEQEEIVVEDVSQEAQIPIVQALLENLGLDFFGNNSRGTGNGSLKPEPTPPVISESSLPDATVNESYNRKLTATNNPTKWTSSGTLPSGLSLDQSSGVISGTPTNAGEFIFNVTAANDDGASKPVRFKITVKDASIYKISAKALRNSISVPQGYMEAPELEVEIANEGNKPIELIQPEDPPNCKIINFPQEPLGGSAKATFTVRLNPGLVAKTYKATITINGSNGVSDTVNLEFVVDEPTSGPEYNINIISEDNNKGEAFADYSKAEPGTEITLSVTEKEGYAFKEWNMYGFNPGSDKFDRNNPDTKFDMPAQNVTITAVFVRVYKITFKTESAGPNGNDYGTGKAFSKKYGESVTTFTAESGESIDLRVIADTGSVFKEWKLDGLSTGAISNGKFVMPDNNVILTAIFKMGNNGNNNIIIGIEGSGTAKATPDKAQPGNSVQLSYTANQGHVFKEWKVDKCDIEIDDSNKFIMPAREVKITAVFEPVVTFSPSFLRVQSAPLVFEAEEMGYEQPDAQTVTLTNIGTQPIELTQPVDADYDVGELSDTTLDVNETVTFTVQPDADLNAGTYDKKIQIMGSNGASAEVGVSFTVAESEPEPEYRIDLQTDGNGTAEISNSQGTTAKPGTDVVIKANAENGYDFIEWQIADGDIETDNNEFDIYSSTINFKMPDGNVTIIAIFTGDSEDSETEEPVEPIDFIKEDDGDADDYGDGDDEGDNIDTDELLVTPITDDIVPISDASEPEPLE